MKTYLAPLLVSCLLHLLAIGGVLALATAPGQRNPPVMIDLTVVQEQQPVARKQSAKQGVPPSPAPVYPNSPAPRKQAPSAQTVQAPAPHLPKPVIAAAAIATAPETAPAVSAAIAALSGASGEHAAASTGDAKANESGPGAGKGLGNSGSGNGGSATSAETLRASYRQEHFNYIRDLIAKNLRYPPKARRMGWSGALKVEFIILENGSVDMIKVVKSSGIPLLDSNAKETVSRSAPFPKPPVSARLIIPLGYVLE